MGGSVRRKETLERARFRLELASANLFLVSVGILGRPKEDQEGYRVTVRRGGDQGKSSCGVFHACSGIGGEGQAPKAHVDFSPSFPPLSPTCV